jgi:recombinational DNA repair protein RecR
MDTFQPKSFKRNETTFEVLTEMIINITSKLQHCTFCYIFSDASEDSNASIFSVGSKFTTYLA